MSELVNFYKIYNIIGLFWILLIYVSLFLVLCFLVPEQPTFLKVIKVDKDTATLSWGLPKKLNGNLTGYLLQYQISK